MTYRGFTRLAIYTPTLAAVHHRWPRGRLNRWRSLILLVAREEDLSGHS